MEPPNGRKNHPTQGQCLIAIPCCIFWNPCASNAVDTDSRSATDINYIYVLLSSIFNGRNSKFFEFGFSREAFRKTLWDNKTYGWTCDILVSFRVEIFSLDCLR